MSNLPPTHYKRYLKCDGGDCLYIATSSSLMMHSNKALSKSHISPHGDISNQNNFNIMVRFALLSENLKVLIPLDSI